MINNDLTAQGVIEVLSSDDPSVSDGEGCYNLELEVSIYYYYNVRLEVSKYDCFKKLIFYKWASMRKSRKFFQRGSNFDVGFFIVFFSSPEPKAHG